MSHRKRNVIFNRTWISNDDFFSKDLLDGEEWRFFDVYNGIQLSGTYGVSNKGRVKGQNGLIMKGAIDEDGYHHINFSVKGQPNNSIGPAVHSVVLHLFIGPPPSDMKDLTVQHINHEKLDNRLENLCWMSQFDNNQEGHAIRAKIVDASGEHIFNSQKVASGYIGRYEDYISECIHNGYKITDVYGQEVDVYTEVGGQWVKYCRPQPNNRRWCKVVQGDAEFIFDSYLACDRFLNKPEGYTSNCVIHNWPVCEDLDSLFYLYDGNDYIKYCPTKKRWRSARRCRITLDNGDELLFDSITAAARYIGKDSEYVRINARDDRTIVDKMGNIINLQIIDAEELERVESAKFVTKHKKNA